MFAKMSCPLRRRNLAVLCVCMSVAGLVLTNWGCSSAGLSSGPTEGATSYLVEDSRSDAPICLNANFASAGETREWLSRFVSSLKKGQTMTVTTISEEDVRDPGRLNIGVDIGNYRLMFRWERHRLGGCINRNDVWHVQLQIRRRVEPQRNIFNAGMAVWWQNRSPQFGIFEEVSGFCAQSRGTWTEIRDAVMRTLATVGITSAAAYAIANLTASTVAVAFAL